MNIYEWNVIKEEIGASVIGNSRKLYILRRIKERIDTLSNNKEINKNEKSN